MTGFRARPAAVYGLLLSLLASCGTREAPPDHLVMVVFDTLRADRMALYGHDRPTTPYLDAARDELLVFADYKAVAPWTLPTHATMFTGLPPAQHRAQWGSMKLSGGFETLAETLAARGFCTVGFSANPLVKPGNGLARGFDTWEHVGGPWTQRTGEILSRIPAVLETVEQEGCRLFLFLNFMDTHIPYNTELFGDQFGVDGPGPIRNAAVKWAVNAGARQLTDEEWEQHESAYDASVRAADGAAERLTAMLGERGRLSETLLVLTSDHGEGLGAHPEVGHSISVWEEQLAVPLVVRFPDGRHAGGTVAETRSQLELAPSLLDWMGIERPSHLASRSSLMTPGDRTVFADYRSYFSEGNRKTNVKVATNYPELAERIKHQHVTYCEDLKLIASEEGDKTAFNIEDDPFEQNDLFAKAADASLRHCVATYQDLARAGVVTPFDALDLTSDDEPDLDALRSLGYVQ